MRLPFCKNVCAFAVFFMEGAGAAHAEDAHAEEVDT